ncbi:MAG TPA: ABC transporter substrate binding protein [Candidatus Acidoferrales bacterium]|nr:ABC transporter substrate binding protein [Candidatus Acidoferrales bacterium]
MSKILRFLGSESANLKSKTCPFDTLRAGSELRRRVENPKWPGLLAILVLLVGYGDVAEAQQAKKSYRIGYISGRSGAGPLDDVFKSALRELGYVERQNMAITYRWAEEKFDRLPALAAELVQLNVDVIVTETTPAARAAKKATTTIPIVMALSGDAVGTGLVASLARPGANVTGLTFIGPDMSGKWVELLKEMSPKTSRLAYLAHPDLPPEVFVFKACSLWPRGWA